MTVRFGKPEDVGKYNMNTLYIWTEDGLRLQGIYYEPQNKNTCVLFVHGMSGNIIENYFADVLGKVLSEQGFGFIYGHNRGYNHINDIIDRNKGEITRQGAMYERFNDCVYDIDAWFLETKRLGYEKIVLMGHSLGCNKTIRYLSKKKPKDVIGVILASPPDMVGLFEKPEYQPNHKELLEEARKNVKEGNPRKLVSGMVWGWYNLSSQTYLDLSEQNGPADNLPVLRNPEEFKELAQINVPILGIMGEKDDIAIRTLEEDMDLIKQKAKSCPSFTAKFVKGANHTYDQEEKQLAKYIIEWLNNNNFV